jgi:hypothetical protein
VAPTVGLGAEGSEADTCTIVIGGPSKTTVGFQRPDNGDRIARFTIR